VVAYTEGICCATKVGVVLVVGRWADMKTVIENRPTTRKNRDHIDWVSTVRLGGWAHDTELISTRLELNDDIGNSDSSRSDRVDDAVRNPSKVRTDLE